MGGFPVDWENAESMDSLAAECPYSLAEIGDYLYRNHYHLVLSEEPAKFEISGPHAERQDADRRYWLFEGCADGEHQKWFVIIGTGKSPFDPSKKVKRWMYAVTNDADVTPSKFLEEEYREQLEADFRAISS